MNFIPGVTVEELEGSSTPKQDFHPDENFLTSFCQDLEKSGMKDSSIFKMVTADTTSPPSHSVELLSEEEKSVWNSIVTSDSELCRVECPTEDSAEHLFLQQHVYVGEKERLSIYEESKGQSGNPKWYLAQKFRITASKVHKIVHARKPDTRLKYFFESSLDIPSVRYGLEAEKRAKEKYEEVTGNKAVQVGLIIKKDQSWLAASPDGVINEKELLLLEIKCPSSCKNKNIDVPYLVNGELKKSHCYYTQIQIQMYVCNAKKCHLFVFSDQDYKLLTVSYDKTFL